METSLNTTMAIIQLSNFSNIDADCLSISHLQAPAITIRMHSASVPDTRNFM